MDERIIIYKSRKKSVRIIAAGLMFILAAVLTFHYAGDEVFGWMFLIAAALILLFGFSNFGDRKPQIIITPQGITELNTIKEEIEWDAIVGADDFFFRGQDFVRILLPTDYKPELLRPTWFWRLDRIYAREGLKALYIRVGGLEINSKQLSTVIRNMAAAAPGSRNEYLRNSVRGKY